MNWPGNHSAENSQKPALLPNPLPYRLPSNDIVAWVRQSLLCWLLQDHSMCDTDQAGAQPEAEDSGDMSQKYSLFCFTTFTILGSPYTNLVYAPSPAQKSCDSCYVHPVLKQGLEPFNLICCSGDWKTSILQNSLFRNKLCMCHCSLQ